MKAAVKSHSNTQGCSCLSLTDNMGNCMHAYEVAVCSQTSSMLAYAGASEVHEH